MLERTVPLSFLVLERLEKRHHPRLYILCISLSTAPAHCFNRWTNQTLTDLPCLVMVPKLWVDNHCWEGGFSERSIIFLPMWIKNPILYHTLSYALISLFVCVCSACRTHTYTHLFPDLKSTTLTPGVPVESGWAALPLTEISTCCLSAASACFSFWQKSIGPSQAIISWLCVWVRTHCAHKMHALTQSRIQTQTESLKTTRGPLLDVFWWQTKCRDREESFDRKRECDSVYSEALYFWHLRVRQCYWSLLWRQGQNNNQGLFRKTQRNVGTRCSFWLKTNWFYYQCHLTWSYIPRGIGGLWFWGMHEHRLLSSLRSLFSPTDRLLCFRLF